jgi:uracil-DNA glycosylase
LRLLRPQLVVPVGGLAIKRLLGVSGLAACIGRRYELDDGAAAIPLPHPSGASSWLNSLENRTLVEGAIDLIRAELARLDEG